MLMNTAFLFLAVAAIQVTSDYIEPKFIEDVIKEESASAARGLRIVSGWEAVLGQHPHHVNLRLVNAIGQVRTCGGSIVHREWVVTAAHCTATSITVLVRGGLVSLTEPEYIFETTQYWNYPTFDNLRPDIVQPNDIGIIKLGTPVTYTRNLQSIRIQSTVDAFRNYENEVLHASGHGMTWTNGPQPENLRWVYLRALSNFECSLTFGSALITSNAICAQWFNVTSQSTCQGDSGGPLVHINSEGERVLVGVTSFVPGGSFGCHSGLPAGFIRPGPFLPWFKEVSGLDFENLNEEDETTTPPPAEETTTLKPEDETTTLEPEDETTTPKPDDEEKPDENEEGGEDEEDSNEDSSPECSDEDGNTSELLKRLQVKVKVKVNVNNFRSKTQIKKRA